MAAQWVVEGFAKGFDLSCNWLSLDSSACSMECGWGFTAFSSDLGWSSIDSQWMLNGACKDFQFVVSVDLGRNSNAALLSFQLVCGGIPINAGWNFH